MHSDESRPAVSVVIGAYNAVHWIEETLQSVLAQTYRDFEIVVVDDGSTDETPMLVAHFGEAVRYVRKENGGAASARNVGIRSARGRYIAFLDHDDLWLPEKLEQQMQLFDEDPSLAWSYTDALFFQSETGQPLHRASQTEPFHEGDILRPLLMGNFIPFATTMVRREVFEEVGCFPESKAYVHVDDWDMWLRIAVLYPIRCVDRVFTRYRVHAVQASQVMDPEQALRNRLRIIDEAVRRTPDRLSDLRGPAEARVYFTIGRIMLNRERRAAARRLLWQSIRRRPADLESCIFWMATFIPRRMLRLFGRVRQVGRYLT